MCTVYGSLAQCVDFYYMHIGMYITVKDYEKSF